VVIGLSILGSNGCLHLNEAADSVDLPMSLHWLLITAETNDIFVELELQNLRTPMQIGISHLKSQNIKP